ncbi:hypothetical protein CKK34_3149 [Yarrowia sp. E02]|nr:hypothetical protein CKK34_3149 [Yarrowia sp. E02]
MENEELTSLQTLFAAYCEAYESGKTLNQFTTTESELQAKAKKYIEHENMLRQVHQAHLHLSGGAVPKDDEEQLSDRLQKADIPSLWTLPHGPERIMNVSVALYIVFGDKVDPIAFACANGCTQNHEWWYLME